MAFYMNKKRQLLGYAENMDEAFHRLDQHLHVSSYVDVPAVRLVATSIGVKRNDINEMNLGRIEAALDKAQQTVLIGEALGLIQALKLERKFQMTEKEVGVFQSC